MSRSRRYIPVTGVTTSESDTRDKVLAHRRQRRWVRTALASDVVEVITRRMLVFDGFGKNPQYEQLFQSTTSVVFI